MIEKYTSEELTVISIDLLDLLSKKYKMELDEITLFLAEFADILKIFKVHIVTGKQIGRAHV